MRSQPFWNDDVRSRSQVARVWRARLLQFISNVTVTQSDGNEKPPVDKSSSSDKDRVTTNKLVYQKTAE